MANQKVIVRRNGKIQARGEKDKSNDKPWTPVRYTPPRRPVPTYHDLALSFVGQRVYATVI